MMFVTVVAVMRIVMLVEKSVIYGMFEWIVVRIVSVMRVVVTVMGVMMYNVVSLWSCDFKHCIRY